MSKNTSGGFAFTFNRGVVFVTGKFALVHTLWRVAPSTTLCSVIHVISHPHQSTLQADHCPLVVIYRTTFSISVAGKRQKVKVKVKPHPRYWFLPQMRSSLAVITLFINAPLWTSSLCYSLRTCANIESAGFISRKIIEDIKHLPFCLAFLYKTREIK